MNNENLIPLKDRSPSEVRAMQSKGGKKSGETRRKKKTIREFLQQLRDMPVKDEKIKKMMDNSGLDTEEERTYGAAVAYAMITKGISGNSQMMRLLCEMMGENKAQDINVTIQENPYTKLSDEQLRKLAESDGE